MQKNSGDFITNLSDGANLVNGKQTWEYAIEGKDNIELMKKCCNAEIKASQKTKMVPAPYYFRRVAILSRKAKNYEEEIKYCTIYLDALANVKRINPETTIQVEALSDWFIKRSEKAGLLLAKSLQKRAKA